MENISLDKILLTKNPKTEITLDKILQDKHISSKIFFEVNITPSQVPPSQVPPEMDMVTGTGMHTTYSLKLKQPLSNVCL